MRFAAFDFGSTSLKCLIAEYDGKQLKVLLDKRISTRLGAELNHNNELSEKGISLSLEALEELMPLCKTAQTDKYLAVGTEALRRAKNTEPLIKTLKNRFDLQLKIISGKEEAELSRLGAAYGLAGTQEFTLFDSGGSSTEFSYGDAEKVSFSISLPLGALRLTQDFLPSDPPIDNDLTRMQTEIESQLTAIKPCKGELLGMGGGIMACAKIALGLDTPLPAELDGYILTQKELQRQTALFLSLPLAKRKQIPGMEAERADIIIAASTLYQAILNKLNRSVIQVCTRGLRHGMILSAGCP